MLTLKEYSEIFEKIFIPSLIPLIVAVITFRLSMRQITNAGVIQARQLWINALRDTLSTFISRAEFIVITEDGNKKDEAYQIMVESQYKIELLLNPLEEDHNNINLLLEEIRNIIFEDVIDEGLFDARISELLNHSKRVLKREWNVVKKGK